MRTGENRPALKSSINVSRSCRAPAARPGRAQRPPSTPPHPPCESTVDRSSSLGHTQPKGCQLLFAVHFAPFCCSSAAPFIIHRSSYCGARYNAQLQHDDGQNTPGRVVSHSVTPLRRRYEWHRGRKRVLVLSCSHARPPRSRVCTRACARVGTPRVRSSKYKVNTSPPWGRLLCTRTLFYRRYITR